MLINNMTEMNDLTEPMKMENFDYPLNLTNFAFCNVEN